MDADPSIGRVVGKVRITGRLGHGAMGMVYRGHHEALGHDVAIKLLLPEKGDRSNYRERFLREGQAAAKVQSPHVVRVLEAGQEDGVAYLVLELVEGTNLGEILKQAGRLPPDQVARIGADLCRGLAAIHAQGIIHRDIKPDNVLIGADRSVRITDLGLARQIDETADTRITATGVVIGTPLYLSPESIRDPREVTTASDIYSLGTTLFHLLAGRPPFEGASPFHVMHGHLDEQPPALRELCPGIDPELAALVARCLDKNPLQRPDALTLAARLSGRGGGWGRALGWGLPTAAGAALLTAIIAWWALGGGTDQGLVRVRSGEAEVRARIDGGPWLRVGDQPLAVPVGSHRCEVETVGPGALMRWSGQAMAKAGEVVDVQAALTPVLVAAPPIEVPGDGLLFVDGLAYGLDPSLTLIQAGSFALARWDGADTWRNLAVRIADDGTVDAGALSTSAQPDAAAYWRIHPRAGQHHMVSRWEALRFVERSGAALPDDWAQTAGRMEDPAHGLSLAMVAAIGREAARLGGALPDPARADTIASALGVRVWAAPGDGPPRLVGAAQRPPRCVLVRLAGP